MLNILLNVYQWNYEIEHEIMRVRKYVAPSMHINAVIVKFMYIMQINKTVSMHFHSSNYLTSE